MTNFRLALNLLLLSQTTSFTPHPTLKTFTTLSQTPLSSSEIADQAKQINESVPSSIFHDALLDDMTRCIKLLGKRVDNGVGSLTSEEVGDVENGLLRVIQEMDDFVGDGANVIDVEPVKQPAPVAMPFPSQTAVTPPTPKSGYGITDMSEDEGPEYTGKGGFGMAHETRNTYAIPGMDEMTPEEYRSALQNSVSDRQAQRKRNMGSNIGNRQSQSYLENLGNPNRFQN